MKKLALLNILFTLAALFTSCNESTSSYWIDNPTNESITVSIDDQAYDIPATSKLDIQLEYGKHQLTYKNQTITFHNGGRTNKVQAIINPTQSTYVFYKQLFMNKGDERATDDYALWALRTQSDSVRLKINDTITTIFAPFQVTNKIFISKADFDWKYNVDETLPETIRLTNPIVTRRNRQLASDPNYQAGKYQETIYKIYREQDFKDYIKQVSNNDIDFLLEKTPYANLPKLKIELTKINDISDPEYKKALEDQVQKFNQWLDVKGSKSTNESKNILMGGNLSELKAEFLKKHPNDYSFNQAVNEFNDQKNPFLLFPLNIILTTK